MLFYEKSHNERSINLNIIIQDKLSYKCYITYIWYISFYNYIMDIIKSVKSADLKFHR